MNWNQLVNSKILFWVPMGILAGLCVIVPLLLLGKQQNNIHKFEQFVEEYGTGEKDEYFVENYEAEMEKLGLEFYQLSKDVKQTIGEIEDRYYRNYEEIVIVENSTYDSSEKDVKGNEKEQDEIAETAMEAPVSHKLTEENLVDWERKPEFNVTKNDTYGNVWENVIYFDRYEYAYKNTCGILRVDEGVKTLCLKMAPSDTLSADAKDGLILEVYKFVEGQEEELLYVSPEFFRTTEMVEQKVNISDVSLLKIKLKNENGPNGTPYSGGILVDCTLE